MTHQDDRPTYTRDELVQRTGLSMSYLEDLYVTRETSGHPEASSRRGHALAWDAETFDTWWNDYNDTSGLATLTQLAEHVGRSVSYLRDLATEPDHPKPRKKLRGNNYYETQEYLSWHRTRTAAGAGSKTNRTGNPDDRITLAEVARVLGKEPANITKYKKRPPLGFPAPVEQDLLPSGRTRDYYRRGDVWDYMDNPRPAGRRGNPGTSKNNQPTENIRSYPHYTGDSRLAIARQALTDTPPDQHPDLPKRLAEQHPPTSPGTWANILTAARQNPHD
ncbi:hypothetical protein LWF15_33455 [Kineosporia rhizophila]|uniref:hypothetical protein n=1 Tax=Kineosporia rhizophila TaxID=84633 RepID=UPI000A4630D4|nr:hypothetical protein [Kineosporia rhizophila]MCE0540412.1 hypothetical protein [Kineosporia rhizophila]